MNIWLWNAFYSLKQIMARNAWVVNRWRLPIRVPILENLKLRFSSAPWCPQSPLTFSLSLSLFTNVHGIRMYVFSVGASICFAQQSRRLNYFPSPRNVIAPLTPRYAVFLPSTSLNKVNVWKSAISMFVPRRIIFVNEKIFPAFLRAHSGHSCSEIRRKCQLSHA